ncbi:hypothetical protein [Methylobacterium goesingense]|uniref:Helix-turn-helix domain-containing protein n=1 Tax=Methylobacterium goesingense TaxID=243690 RepID=A0ABV2L3G1_9HYPH|nr:hypothetical protein [Methylobacterium goesingense]GJD73116.1 hypothetical protein CFIICLFH_1341 [Methylobacterium goesingense]
MSRIRSIHPGLFTDEAFVSLSAPAQVLWIGLWCEADDQGVFEWKPLTLKMRLMPASTESVEPLLQELLDAGCICRFEEGRPYGVVRNFVKHQRPKSPKVVHPLPESHRNYAGFNGDGSRPDATTGRKRFASSSEPVPAEFGTGSECGSQMEDVGCRMKGKGGEQIPEPLPEKTEPVTRTAASRSVPETSRYFFEAGVIRLNEVDFRKWETAFPSVSLRAELTGLAGWAADQPNWFFAVPGALAKRDREARLAVERIKAEAIANANAPKPKACGYVP